jgi:hypothetical protein
VTYTRERFNATAPDGGSLAKLTTWVKAQFTSVQRSIPWAQYADARDFITVGEGADVSNQLAQATRAALGNGVYFAARTYRLTANATIDGTLLQAAAGAVLEPQTGVTLWIKGQFEAGDYTVFSKAGGGKVRFIDASGPNPHISTFRARWFGVKGDESQDETPFLVFMMESLRDTDNIVVRNKHITFTQGMRCRLDTKWTVQSLDDVTFHCPGTPFDSYAGVAYNSAQFRWNGAAGAIMIQSNNNAFVQWQGFVFDAGAGDVGMEWTQVGGVTGTATHNRWINCQFLVSINNVRPDAIGCRIGHAATGNCEEAEFVWCRFTGVNALGSLVHIYNDGVFFATVAGTFTVGTNRIVGLTSDLSAQVLVGQEAVIAGAGTNHTGVNTDVISGTGPRGALTTTVTAVMTVTVAAPGALAGATSLPVVALTQAIANGTTLTFASGKVATLTAAAAIGATSLTVGALAAGISAADFACSITLTDNAQATVTSPHMLFGSAYGSGVVIEMQNSHWIKFHDCLFTYLGTGIGNAEGSHVCHRCNFTECDADVYTASNSMPCKEYDTNSENSRQHHTGAGGGAPYKILGGRWDVHACRPGHGFIEILGVGNFELDCTQFEQDPISGAILDMSQAAGKCVWFRNTNLIGRFGTLTDTQLGVLNLPNAARVIFDGAIPSNAPSGTTRITYTDVAGGKDLVEHYGDGYVALKAHNEDLLTSRLVNEEFGFYEDGNNNRLLARWQDHTGTQYIREVPPANIRASTKTAAYTVVQADNGKRIPVDATGAARTVTITNLAAGTYLYIGKVDGGANTVTIDGTAAGVTIEGAATHVIAARGWRYLAFNGDATVDLISGA